jgi:hypothetical protein
VIPLLNLRKLTIYDLPAHSTFLNHLSIPTGASLYLDLSFLDDGPSVPVCLANDFENLHHITTVAINVDTPLGICMRLKGPSGGLHIHGVLSIPSLFLSLSKFDLSRTQRLSVTAFNDTPTDDFPIFQTLLLMKSLRTLRLIEVNLIPFISALNPKRNESHTVPCSELEELVLYIRSQYQIIPLGELKKMASERAKASSKLSSIKSSVWANSSRGRLFSRSGIMFHIWSTSWRLGHLSGMLPLVTEMTVVTRVTGTAFDMIIEAVMTRKSTRACLNIGWKVYNYLTEPQSFGTLFSATLYVQIQRCNDSCLPVFLPVMYNRVVISAWTSLCIMVDR